MIEEHPHLRLFDESKPWRYLIIGTFPPNTSLRSADKQYVDYFYGNKGFLWKIIHDLYQSEGYRFFGGTKEQNLAEIKRWQHDFCVGLTDTIIRTSRKSPMSSDDADFTNIEYNHPLRRYVLDHAGDLKKLIFTSSSGKNSAFENFRKIMGADLSLVNHLLATGLPSPSGSANITFFNSRREDTFGLTQDFFQFVATQHPELIAEFRERWEIKKKLRMGTDAHEIRVPATPKGIVAKYKLWRYRSVLPVEKCR